MGNTDISELRLNWYMHKETVDNCDIERMLSDAQYSQYIDRCMEYFNRTTHAVAEYQVTNEEELPIILGIAYELSKMDDSTAFTNEIRKIIFNVQLFIQKNREQNHFASTLAFSSKQLLRAA